jgi:hypothetical protein
MIENAILVFPTGDNNSQLTTYSTDTDSIRILPQCHSRTTGT